jgi:general secretion pathway protein H
VQIRFAGFSLIELLVVLLIIGLSLGAVGVAVGNGSESRQQSLALQQLAGEIEQQLYQSQADGRDRGIAIYPLRRAAWAWSWYRYEESRWRPAEPASNDPPLPLLHSPAVPVLQVDGRYLQLAGRGAVAALEERIQLPDIVLYSSGELTPFQLALQPEASTGNRLWLCGDAVGRLSVVSAPVGGCEGEGP